MFDLLLCTTRKTRVMTLVYTQCYLVCCQWDKNWVSVRSGDSNAPTYLIRSRHQYYVPSWHRGGGSDVGRYTHSYPQYPDHVECALKPASWDVNKHFVGCYWHTLVGWWRCYNTWQRWCHFANLTCLWNHMSWCCQRSGHTGRKHRHTHTANLH